jgi:hypothetical protein
MKKSRIFYLFILFSIFIAGCKGYEIKNETIPASALNTYKKIHVDWLDLKEENWTVYNYASPQEWKREINDQNVKGFFEYVKNSLRGRECSFASSASDKDVKGMDLHIKISVLSLEYKTWPRIVLLTTQVNYIDVKTNKEIYCVSLTSEGKGFNFEDKLNNAIYIFANFITDKCN